MPFNQVIEAIGRVIDLAGVVAIAGAVTLATIVAATRVLGHQPEAYPRFRRDVGRGILVGLEVLVAADIVRTVAISPTLESVAVLAAIVLVRTFLSFVLEVEVTGTWPWHRGPEAEAERQPR